MKVSKVMKTDEKFAKADENEAKSIFVSNKKLIRPIVSSLGRGNPKVGRG